MYAKIIDGVVVEYPITNIRKRLPSTSLPANLSKSSDLPGGYVYVHPGKPPKFDPNAQKLGTPRVVHRNDRWEVVHTVEPLPDTEIEINFIRQQETLRDLVDSIRDELMDAGVEYNGVLFQTRAQDRENITDELMLAILKKLNHQFYETEWIVADNSRHLLDEEDIIKLATLVANRRTELTFRAREIKDLIDAAVSVKDLPDVAGLMRYEKK